VTGRGLRPEAVIERLIAAGCVAAEEEAAELIDAAADAETLESWIRRREQGEPIAWITGTIEFCGRRLEVDPGVYVPRIQSEELARRAVELLSAVQRRRQGRCGRAADLCTGAGAIASHLIAEVAGASVSGTDIDVRAVVCARRNGVQVVLGDLGAPLAGNSFDVVTSVAPYVPTGELKLLPADVLRYEPRIALDGGREGLDVLQRIVSCASRLLRSGGWLLVEVGGDQDELIAPALCEAGFEAVESFFDSDGDLRGLVARSSRAGIPATK
jgi:release factor glutamine methyltransferase